MTELERALLHIKTRADLWAVREVEQALSQEPSRGWEEMTVPCENCGHDMTFKIAVCGEQEPCEKSMNKAYTFGKNKGVKAYYNEQLCTVELPEAVFRYILSLVPTEETEQELCDDAISREDALNGVDAMYNNSWDLRDFRQNVDLMLKELPSVTQKSGKWIAHSDGIWIEYYECSECGRGHVTHSDYCPNCGCRMVEPQESEDKE